jgi:hypothetical protein
MSDLKADQPVAPTGRRNTAFAGHAAIALYLIAAALLVQALPLWAALTVLTPAGVGVLVLQPAGRRA